MNNSKFEYGIDNNNDGHCDLCGRFVDENGHHKACLIYSDEQQILDSFEDFINNHYNPYIYKYPGDSTKIGVLRYFYDYTLNDIDNPYSSPAINGFLRLNKIHPNAKISELVSRIGYMNLMINQYELKKDLVTFRGMSFNEDDDFTKELEEKRIKLNKEKEPVEFIDKGFVSTSRNKDIALEYAKKYNKKIKVILSYVLIKGSCAMPLDSKFLNSKDSLDNEIILKSYQAANLVRLQRFKSDDKIIYKGIVVVKKGD